VAGVSHFGDVLQYVVTSGDRDILVLTPRTNGSRFHSGDEVYCSWSADEVYLFSARQAAIVLHDGTDGSPISDPTSDRKKEKAI